MALKLVSLYRGSTVCILSILLSMANSVQTRLRAADPDQAEGFEAFGAYCHLFEDPTHFRKHEAKHSKPYICQVPNCKHTRFGDKGGLDRHSRGSSVNLW